YLAPEIATNNSTHPPRDYHTNSATAVFGPGTTSPDHLQKLRYPLSLQKRTHYRLNLARSLSHMRKRRMLCMAGMPCTASFFFSERLFSANDFHRGSEGSPLVKPG